MNQTYTYLPSLLEQIPDILPDSIISRTIYDDDQVRVIIFAFAEGQELSEHTSAQAAILHFVKGEADLKLGNDSQTAKTGTWVRMPPNLPHSIYAKTSLWMLLLMLKKE